MATRVIIPARYESSRFPGKPLQIIKGWHGEEKTLIRRTWEAAIKAFHPMDVYVATDDKRVAEHVESFGKVVMTSPDLRNGTERCAAAANIIGLNATDVVVNVQGDSPLMPANWIRGIAEEAKRSPIRDGLLTVAVPLPSGYLGRPGSVSVALISPSLHPNSDKVFASLFLRGRFPSNGPWLMHYGLYAYTVGTLRRYMERPPMPYERCESLEQLRFIEYGDPVRVLVVSPEGAPETEVNYPTDIPVVEKELEICRIR